MRNLSGKVGFLPWTEESGAKDIDGPLLAAEHLVHAGRDVACGGAQEDVADESGGHEGATRGRRQEAKTGEHERDKGHHADLHTTTTERAQQETLGRWTEDVAVHQLPAELLLDIVAGILRAIVLGQVLVHGAEQNHGDHTAEEEHNDERVDNAEPLDLGVWHGVQDVVPARGPLDVIVLLELDRVRVRYG